jgi:DNA-cytosine methyltransferase
MNVFSGFDGMSCAQIALNKLGIKPDKYYASEVDKYAIQVTQANYPNTVQMGDITKWREWDINWSSIDLIVGGSPCQGFSFAGKQLAFDDPRSKLFFVYVDILKHIRALNPDVKFMLENVRMKKEYLDVISRVLGVEPVFINSALVSAQNRQRFYWANWNIEQPADKGIFLADILESEGFGVIKNHGELKPKNDKSQCIDANYHKGADNHGQRTVILKQKPRGNNKGFEKEVSKSPTVSANSWEHNNHVKSMYIHGVRGPQFMEDGKAYALTANQAGGGKALVSVKQKAYRKLTPRECGRLQTVPEPIIDVMLSCGVSNTQLYKMLGNGWTVDVIAHNFSTMQSAEVLPIKADQLDMFGNIL